MASIISNTHTGDCVKPTSKPLLQRLMECPSHKVGGHNSIFPVLGFAVTEGDRVDRN